MSSFDRWLHEKEDCETCCGAGKPARAPAAPSIHFTGDPFQDKLLAAFDASARPATDKGDESPLVAEARAIFADEKLAEERYVAAIAEGLKTPYVIFDQPNANAPLLAGNWRVLINVPSVVPGIGVAPTFDAATAFDYTMKAFARDPSLAQSFESFLCRQLPPAVLEELMRTADYFVPLVRQHPEYSLDTCRSITADLLRKEKSTSGDPDGSVPDDKYMEDPWLCGDKLRYPKLRNPSWYLGFIHDTFIELTGVSRLEHPMGRFLIGSPLHSPVEMAVRLPGYWGSQNVTQFHYKIALRAATDVVYPGIAGFTDRLLTTLFSYYQYPTGDEVGENEFLIGVVFIFNADIWRCHNESLARYKPFESAEGWDDWWAMSTNLFDHVALRADHIAEYHWLTPPVDITVTNLSIALNNQWILQDHSLAVSLIPQQWAPTAEFDADIREFRRNRIRPTQPSSSITPLPGLSALEMVRRASNNAIIAQAAQDLGQAWSAKYGGDWFFRELLGWLPGPYSWCSESSMWFIREANRQFHFIDLDDLETVFRSAGRPNGVNISMTYWIRWFLCRGRYISGRTASWNDLGTLLLPGYWVSSRNVEHSILFMYWTQPPHIPHPNHPGSNRNDPFNVVHREFDGMAAQFDPSLKVNRFRSIAGNESCRVSMSNYSVIRVGSEDELEAWKNAPLPAGGDQGRYDLVRNNVVFFRDDLNESGKSSFESELLQDGFGVTFGSPLFLGSPDACREVGL